MENIETFIESSNKLTDIFGYWPSFHDAEVIELTSSKWKDSITRTPFSDFSIALHIHLFENLTRRRERLDKNCLLVCH